MTESAGKLVEEYIESDPFLKELFAFSKQPRRKDNTFQNQAQKQYVLTSKQNRTMGSQKLGTILNGHISKIPSKQLEGSEKSSASSNAGTNQGTFSINRIQQGAGIPFKTVSPYLPSNQNEKTDNISQRISNQRKSDYLLVLSKENLTTNQSNSQNLHSQSFNDQIQGNNTTNRDISGIDINPIQFSHFSITKQTNRNTNSSITKKNIRNRSSSSLMSSKRENNCQIDQKIHQHQQQQHSHVLKNVQANSSSQRILSQIFHPQHSENLPCQAQSQNQGELIFQEQSISAKQESQQRACRTETDSENTQMFTKIQTNQQLNQTIEPQLSSEEEQLHDKITSLSTFLHSTLGLGSPEIDFSKELSCLLSEHVLKRNHEHNLSEYLISLQNISLAEAIYLQVLLLITEQSHILVEMSALRDLANKALESAYFEVFSAFNKGNKDLVQKLIVCDCYLVNRLCFKYHKLLRGKCSLVGIFDAVILITHMTTGLLVSDAFVAAHINQLFNETFMQYENNEQEELSQRVASFRRNGQEDHMNNSNSASFLGVQLKQPSSSQFISELGLQIQGQQHLSGVKSVTQLTHLPLKIPNSLYPSAIQLLKSYHEPPEDQPSINKSVNLSTHRRTNSEHTKNSKFNCAATGNIIGKLLDQKLLKSVQGNIITRQMAKDTQKQRSKLQFMLEDLQSSRLKRAQSVACQRSSSTHEDQNPIEIIASNADEYKLNFTEQKLAKKSWVRSGNEQINHTFLQKPIQLNYLLNKLRTKDKQNQIKDTNQSEKAERFVVRLRKTSQPSRSSSTNQIKHNVKFTYDQQSNGIIADQENFNGIKGQPDDLRKVNRLNNNNNNRYISPADRAKQPVIEARKMIRQTDKMINTLRCFFK